MSEQRSTRIVVNGQEYHSLEEMPPEVRSLYERALQMAAEEDARDIAGPGGAAASSPPADTGSHISVKQVVTSTKFVVNGKEYASIDEMPADVAGQVRAAVASAGSEGLAGGTAPRHPTRPTQAAARIPNFEAHERPHVRLRVSALRLALWLAAMLLIILLYLRRR